MLNRSRRAKRLEHLRQQYDQGIQFHRQEFSEIEAKVKYWLTFLLPASLGILGFLLQAGEAGLGYYATASSVAALVLLLAVIFTFAQSLRVSSIEAGIVRPSIPKISEMDYYLNDQDELWNEYLEAEVTELLRAFENNERANSQKAKWLIRGQTLLFFGFPAAPALAVVAGKALLYAGPNEFGLAVGGLLSSTAVTSGIGAGATAGIAVTGFLAILSHGRTSSS